MLRDQDFGVLRLRAFGTYALTATDAKALVKEHAGTNAQVLVTDLQEHLRNKIVARFTDSLAESKVAALDLASRYDELSADLGKRLNAELLEQGLGVSDFHIENISLPPEVEKALDARSKMAVLGDLGNYTKLQAADSLPIAAGNSGIAGAGVGMGVGAGMGVAMGQQMTEAMRQPGTPAAPDAFAPKVAGSAADVPAVAGAAAVSGSAKFCHECGTKAVAGSKFCGNCGTKLA
jgi:membrane protease subunit (stomatin/prohibitin family)